MGRCQMVAVITHLQLQLQLLRLPGEARLVKPPPVTVWVSDARRMLAKLAALAACLTCSANSVPVLKLCGGQQQP